MNKEMIQHLLSPREDQILPILQSELSIDVEYSKFLLNLGSVYHNHSRTTTNSQVKTGDYIRIHTNPRRFPVNYNWREFIHFDHPEFIIINKPFGVPTHSSVDNIIENTLYQMSLALSQPLYVTHRLDVATSGLLCIAKTKDFQRKFNFCLKDKLIEKKYQAKVQGHIHYKGIVRHFMEQTTYLPKKLSAERQDGWQECLLEIENFEHLYSEKSIPYSLVGIRLITGRTHQIRSQLAALGHPILEDKIYGSQMCSSNERWEKVENIELRAVYLKFQIDTEIFEFNILTKN